jgi:hypothetical protein
MALDCGKFAVLDIILKTATTTADLRFNHGCPWATARKPHSHNSRFFNRF